MKQTGPLSMLWRGVLRPRSIIGFVLAAFAGVALPLIIAIGTGLFYVDRLNQQSERLVRQGMTVTRETKHLSSLLIDMERSIRQYQVLDTPELLERFTAHSDAFANALDDLAGSAIPTLPNAQLVRMATRIRTLPDRLESGPATVDSVLQSLSETRDTVDELGEQGRRFVQRALDTLKATATTARRVMIICLFALVPIVIVLAVGLGFAIARPLRQIVTAIRHLGEGEMSRRIEIGAPVAELDRIGERLDWMRARLADQEQQKQQFLRHISHELKTPLASIREGASLLADGSLGALTREQNEVAGIVDKSAVELTGLVDNLLNFAAWREAHTRLEIETCDIPALIETQVERHRLTREARGLRVETPETQVRFALDRERFVLIIDNLLTNALKYAPADSVVRIELEEHDVGLDLYVIDEGAGVPLDEREQIFEAFARGTSHAVERSHVSGTGIGLSVVRECAQAHGGHADIVAHDVYSSVFHVHIPRPTRA